MSGRVASLGFLLAFEARVAWRRAAGERRLLAGIAILLFWIGLHGAAVSGLRGASLDGLRGNVRVAAGLAALFVLLMLVAAAFGLAVHALFERRDLDLVGAAPVPARTVWAVRALAIAGSVAAFPAYFWLPVVHAAAWHGEARLLVGYPALAAMALLATAFAILATLALARRVGPRRARTLAQVVGAIFGASVFLAFQLHAFLPMTWREAIATAFSTGPGRAWIGESSPLWGLSRAVLGDAAPLAVLVVLAGGLFVLAVGAAARAQAAGVLETVSEGRERSDARGADGRSAFGRNLAITVLAKEWRLIARDPRAILHTLLPLLYLAPLLLAGTRRGESESLLAPSVVVLAGFLAGGLAWLAASGEEAPDLLATSPVAPSERLLLKALSACLPALAVALPFFAIEALRPGGAPFAFAFCLAGSVGGCALVQIRGAQPGARRDLARGAQPGRWVALIEHAGAAGWGAACWGYLVGSPAGLAGLFVGLAAPFIANAARARES